MFEVLKSLQKEELGQDLIEYGMIALIVALGAIAGVGSLATSINSLYGDIAGELA